MADAEKKPLSIAETIEAYAGSRKAILRLSPGESDNKREALL